MTMTKTLARFSVHAGAHDRPECPLELTLPQALPDASYQAVTDAGVSIPLQRRSATQVALLVPAMAAGESRTFGVVEAEKAHEPEVTLLDREGRIDIARHGALLTRYHYADVPARPYFWPLFAPGEAPVTRAYPMQTDVPDEMHDHPHHRSLWVAFGEVNGTDNWSEEKGHGYTAHQAFESLGSGAVSGGFRSRSLWQSVNKEPVLTQMLDCTIWATEGSARLLDFEVALIATAGAVHFGDTKEGGILSVRVASALDVPRGGRIENTYGGIDEGETWGKAAHWCDYSGTVEGKHVGIAVLDHYDSFRYPTHWHVRDYGLMTVNPFGYAAYTKGAKNGSHTLAAGESLRFRYRVVLHAGDASAGQVNAHYLNFVAPPRVTWEEVGP